MASGRHFCKRNMLLVFEGLPAAGKTTMADLLCVHRGAVKVNESLGSLSNSTATDDQRLIFEDTLDKYRAAQSANGLVVIDRGYPSLLAWDYCSDQLGFSHSQFNDKRTWVEYSLTRGEIQEPWRDV